MLFQDRRSLRCPAAASVSLARVSVFWYARKIRVTDIVVRIIVGFENIENIKRDIRQALNVPRQPCAA